MNHFSFFHSSSEFIREALSPAEVVKVEIEGKKAKVYVTEDQQSIAIGRQGQNVRLASKLTGYDLDIELAKAPEKKKRKNAEDSLLNALSDSETATEEVSVETTEDTAEAAASEATAETDTAKAEVDEKATSVEETDSAEKVDEA